MKIKQTLAYQLGKTIRVKQWYKNTIVFLAIFFSGNILNTQTLFQTIIAFFTLSFLSSAGYIINDLKDRKEDQLHPERKLRPLASGLIRPTLAVTVCIFLIVVGSYLALRINRSFAITAGIFFLLGQTYTFFLKKIIFADIITISSLFVLRAIAGAMAISVIISPWLILVPFFLALFLAAGKRYSDLHLLQEKAGATKKVLQEYTPEITNTLMIISTTLLIVSYALYSFLSEHPLLIITIPVALYTIFRFYSLTTSGSPIARNPEKSIKDKPFLSGMVLWLLTTTAVIYLL